MPPRPRRAVAPPTSASLDRSGQQTALDPAKRSIRLTVKAPPSKLREVTTNTHDELPQSRPSRSTKNHRARYAISSDDEDDEEEYDEGQDAADDMDVDVSETFAQDNDSEAEGTADDEDMIMTDAPRQAAAKPKPLPTIKFKVATASNTPPARKPSPGSKLKHVQSVEDKQLADAENAAAPSLTRPAARALPASDDEDEDENLSNLSADDANGDNLDDLDDDDEDDDPEDDELGDEDPDGEGDLDDDELDDEMNEEEDGDIPAGVLPGTEPASASSTPDSSRAGTPDITKLTRRQRAHIEEEGGLMALSNEAQKKKFFTAEQITMRRAEMARRRKDLSEKRNEQEKSDTLRRLLEKPVPTRRTRAQVIADNEREEFGLGAYEDADNPNPAKQGCLRVVMGAERTVVGVPGDWLEGPVGRVFQGSTRKEEEDGAKEAIPVQWKRVSRMVEEVA